MNARRLIESVSTHRAHERLAGRMSQTLLNRPTRRNEGKGTMNASRLLGAQLAVLGVFACVLFASAPASAHGIHVFSGSFTADTGAHALSDPGAVAVNNATGNVYVVDAGNKRVEEFNSTGTAFIAEFAAPGGFSSPEAIAVDNSGNALDPSKGDVYVTDTGAHVVDKFSATGEYNGQLTGTCENAGEVVVEPGACPGSATKAVIPFTGLAGVAVGASGTVWVSQENGQIDSYSDEKSTEFLSSHESVFETGQAGPGLALDSHEDLYVSHALSEPAIGSVNSAYELLVRYYQEEREEGGVFPLEPAFAVAVNTSNNGVLLDHETSIGYFDAISSCVASKPCYTAPKGSLTQPFGEGHLEESAGVAVNSSLGTTSSGTVYATDRSSGAVRVFAEVSVPDVTTGAPSQVSETSELLRGTVNPSGEPLGDCSFEYAEYGTESGVYPHTVACQQTPAEIGSGNEPVQVSAEISGLKPGLRDNFRLTAGNINGVVHGSNESFTPFRLLGPPSLSLPDGRAYELVSTIEGTEVFIPRSGQPESTFEEEGELQASQGGYRAAATGVAVAYVGGLSPSGVGGFAVARNDGGDLYLSKRSASGWSEGNIDPVPSGRNIDSFSADLSQQFMNINEPQFNNAHGQSAACAENNIYTRSGGVGDETYQPLVTGAVVSGEECQHLTFAGASWDDSHLLFQSPGAYTQGATKGSSGSPENGFGAQGQQGYDNLYDSVAGQLHQVNVLPDGESEQNPYAVFGGLIYLGEHEYEHNLANDMSMDDSRVFWTSMSTKSLYVRENDTQSQSRVVGEHCTEPGKACTIQIDQAQPGAEGTSGGGTFWTSSSDGSRVFFTDCSRLTEGSTAVTSRSCSHEVPTPESGEPLVPAGNDLYEYNLDSGRLTDVTLDHNSSDVLGADVQGVIGASGDGSNVYFVANGVLAGENDEARKPVSNQPNLYVVHDGETSFIATLEIEDQRFLGISEDASVGEEDEAGDWKLSPGLRSAATSRNGDVVAFMSRLPLTDYDNLGCKSVFGQETTGRCPEVFVYSIHAGRVLCASCTPSGAPPLAETTEPWEENLGGHVAVSGNNTFGLRWLNAEGTQVYFDSSASLVSRDTNDRQDVYEWESQGSGGCSRVEGCVSLLSGGDSPRDAFFLDASESGRDVFFTSREQFLPDGGGEFVKLYDARVGGGFAELEQACTGTGCQGVASAPPIFATPSSVTFNGIGNFPPLAAVVKGKPKSKPQAKCRKHFAKKRGRCMKAPARKRTKSAQKGRK